MVRLSFGKLNLVKEQHYSLLELLHIFQPTLEKLTAKQLEVCKLLFILDESTLALDFEDHLKGGPLGHDLRMTQRPTAGVSN